MVLLFVALPSAVYFTIIIKNKIKIKLEQDKYKWSRDIIANWTTLIKEEDLKTRLKLNIANTDRAGTSLKNTNRSYLLHILKDLETQNEQHLKKTLEKLCGLRKLHPKESNWKSWEGSERWKKRDNDVCRSKLQSAKELLQTYITEDYADHFFEKFIFSIADYETIIKNRQQLAKAVIDKIEETFNEGSFECLITFLDEKNLGNLVVGDFDLAIKLELESLIASSTILTILETEWKSTVKSWKNRRIKMSIQLPFQKRFASSILIERITSCSELFIQILAMYPDPATVVDSSVVMIPLVDDIVWRLQNSIERNKLNHLMELVCCDKHIVKSLFKDQDKAKVNIWFQMEESSSIAGKDRGQKDHKEDSTNFAKSRLLTANAEFLKLELSVTIFTQNQTDHAEKFNNFSDDSRLVRVDRVRNLIEYTEKNKLIPSFMEILKLEHKFIFNRLKQSETVYAASSNTLRNNIIQNIRQIAKTDIDLEKLEKEFVNRCVDLDVVDSIKNEKLKKKSLICNVLVKILLSGRNAMCAFVDALYTQGKNDIADKLMSTVALPKEHKDKDVHNLLKEGRTDIFLGAAFRVEFFK